MRLWSMVETSCWGGGNELTGTLCIVAQRQWAQGIEGPKRGKVDDTCRVDRRTGMVLLAAGAKAIGYIAARAVLLSARPGTKKRPVRNPDRYFNC